MVSASPGIGYDASKGTWIYPGRRVGFKTILSNYTMLNLGTTWSVQRAANPLARIRRVQVLLVQARHTWQ